MVRGIVFDLGNVILDQHISYGGDYFADATGSPKKSSHAFYERYKYDMMTGRKTFFEILSLMKTELNISTPLQELYKSFVDHYVMDVDGVNDRILEIVKKLSENYPVYIMTNTIAPHFDYWESFGLNKYFKRIFRSDADHFMKPEVNAYKFVLDQIGIKAEESVFIDDLKVNVDGAKQAGMNGFVYKNPEKLVDDLKKNGIAI